MKIERRKFFEWDKTTQMQLKRATLPGGYLKHFIRLFPESPTIVVFEQKRIKGWAFAFFHEGTTDLFLFVHRQYRRQGVATLLITEAMKDFPTIMLAKWNGVTARFFQKMHRTHPSKVQVYDWWKSLSRYSKLLQLTPAS
ncbi:MAG: GNAT family N-acetyltransferase [bacterium]|nr:GNAT family N-acetyltransferase [bacterium]